MKDFFLGKTFDDFLIRPQLGLLERRDRASLTMPLSRNIKISLPIVAANMDTVTGAGMMKAMALEGGFAFLHRNCSIADQVAMVKDVKRQHSHVVEKPLIISPEETIADAIRITREHNISCLLIEKYKGSGILVGILSKRDLEFAKNMLAFNEKAADFKGTKWPLAVADPTVSMEVAEKIMLDTRVEKLPLVKIINGDMHIKGLVTLRDLRAAQQRPYSSKDHKGRLLVGAAIGATGDYLERAAELIKYGADCILIDIAHGHSKVMEKAIKNFREHFDSRTQLICGNVATYEGSLFLAQLGVDGIKVGVGPGKGCRTRLETGFGVPQLQALQEARFALHVHFCGPSPIPIIADGGMKNDKDIFLAIACGASTVMLGSMLSGTDESPGDIITDSATRQKVKFYRGMTSPEAVLSKDGATEDSLNRPAEGQTHKMPYVGSVTDVLRRIRGHLQSSVSYSGTGSLAEAHTEISENPELYLIPLSEASKVESFER